ncbi:MAG: DUF4115 domain-containing protein [Actinomycetes bacterium]
MGRHRAPSTESTALPRSLLAVGGAAVLVVLVLGVGIFAAMRGDGNDTTTAGSQHPPASASAGTTTAAAASPSPSATASEASPSPTATKRAPTLNLTMTGTSYVSVRLPNGRSLVAKTFSKGQSKSFDEKALRVTIGNAAAVRVTVNGRLRAPGRRGQVVTFTARRK